MDQERFEWPKWRKRSEQELDDRNHFALILESRYVVCVYIYYDR